MLKQINETVEYLKSVIETTPEIGIILGTGLGALVNEIDIKFSIPYSDIPNFKSSTVEGHSGRLIIGKLSGKNIIAMQGRFHFYEGYEIKEVVFPVRVMKKDFDLGFEETPVCLKQRGGNSNYDKKVAGKKRLLTREQKNELLSKTQMSFYEEQIARGDMSIENAMYAIKDAFERKQNFEEMGYILPTKKTEYPYWADDATGA